MEFQELNPSSYHLEKAIVIYYLELFWQKTQNVWAECLEQVVEMGLLQWGIACYDVYVVSSSIEIADLELHF